MDLSARANLAMIAAVILINVYIVISRPPPTSSDSYEDCDEYGNCYNVTKNQYDYYYYYNDYSDSGSSNAQPSNVNNIYHTSNSNSNTNSNSNSNSYITNESKTSNNYNYNYEYNGQSGNTNAQPSTASPASPQGGNKQSQSYDQNGGFNVKGGASFKPPNAGGIIGDLISIPNEIIGQAVGQASGIGGDWLDIANTPLKLANDVLGGIGGRGSVSSKDQYSQQPQDFQSPGVRGGASFHGGFLG